MLLPIVLVLIHLAAVIGLISLLPRAPCWMQFTVGIGLAISMAVFAIAFGLRAAGDGSWWKVAVLAAFIEHLSLLLYVFRLVYKEHLQWNSSQLSVE